MFVATSPYHLTTREPAVMAALLLAERVVTLRPVAIGGRAAAEKSQTFREFARSWEWTLPLWKEAVLVAECDGANPYDDMLATVDRIRTDSAFAAFRGFLHDGLGEDERQYLGLIAADLLKGGPDPGLSVPLLAGLDRFAARHQLLVARGHPTSVAQRAEMRIASPVFSVAIPMLLQADAMRLLHVREVLAKQLAFVRDACDRLAIDEAERRAGFQSGGASESQPAGTHRSDPLALADLAEATAQYSEAFEANRDDLMDGSGDDEVRVVEGYASIQAVRLPVDAVLRAAVEAVGALASVSGLPRAKDADGLNGGDGTAGDGGKQNALARLDPAEGRSFLGLVVKPMGQRTKAR